MIMEWAVVIRYAFVIMIKIMYFSFYNLTFQYGGSYRYEDVDKAKAQCIVLPGIECHGPRQFYKEGFPCVKYVLFKNALAIYILFLAMFY